MTGSHDCENQQRNSLFSIYQGAIQVVGIPEQVLEWQIPAHDALIVLVEHPDHLRNAAWKMVK